MPVFAIVALVLHLTGPALAATTGAADCLQCCQQSGLPACGTDIYVDGDGTRVTKEGNAWRASGLFVMSCDGRGFFDDGHTAVYATAPSAGDAAKSSSAQWACFAKNCQLPVGLCFDADAGRVTDCATGAGPTAAQLRGAPGPKRPAPYVAPSSSPTASAATPGGLIVVVGGKSLSVQVAPAEAAPSSPTPASPASAATWTPTPAPAWTPTPAPTPVAQAPVPPAPVAPAPKPKPSVLFDDLSDDDIRADPEKAAATATAVTPVVAPVAAPPVPTAAATAGKTDPMTQLTVGLPKDPPQDCEAPSDELHSEARKQVMAGDDLRLAKDVSGAVSKYRAALSMDTCNAYAWFGLGESAIVLNRQDIAIRALHNTITLMPQNYGAWLDLGQAYEAIRQVDAAVAAYQQALAAKPGLQAAVDGLARLGVH